MNITCDIINDLLPFYTDGVCGKETKEIVDAHLAECEACRNVYSCMAENAGITHVKNCAVPKKKVMKKIGDRFTAGIIIAALIVSLAVAALFLIDSVYSLQVSVLSILFIMSLTATMVLSYRIKNGGILGICLFGIAGMIIGLGNFYFALFGILPSIPGAVAGLIVKRIFR